MAQKKKKIGALLVTVALVISALAVHSGRSVRAEPKKPFFDKAGPLFANDPNFSSSSTNGPTTGELMRKMMIMVLLVVGLGAGAIYCLKKFLPKITSMPGKEVRIIETTHLGQRKAVHLLEVGNQRILIGSTNDSITMLADLTQYCSEIDHSEMEIPVHRNK